MLHWQSRTNEDFHPFGDGGVAFDFDVRFFECASIPRIAIVDASDRMLRVVELEIADDGSKMTGAMDADTVPLPMTLIASAPA